MAFGHDRPGLTFEQFCAKVKKMTFVFYWQGELRKADVPLNFYRTPIFHFKVVP